MATKKTKKAKDDKYVVVDPMSPVNILAQGSTVLSLEKQIHKNDYLYDMDEGSEWVFDLYEKVGTVSLKKPVPTLEIKLKK